MSFILEAEDVGKIYKLKNKKIEAVSNLSLNLRRGQILGLIGLNGAGKSTTIKMLTGLMAPTFGKVKVLDKDPFRDRKSIVKKISVIFGQKSQLIWDLPAYDSFYLMGSLYKCKKKDVKEIITYYDNLFKFSAFANRPVRTLSLGQRMICELTAALIHNPEILFLDEPTLGLDVINKTRMRNLLMTLVKEKGTSIILTSHDLIDLEKLADNLLVLREGQTIFQGSMDEFTERVGKRLQIILIGREESWKKLVNSKNIKTGNIEIIVNDYEKKVIFNENEISLDLMIKMINEVDSEFTFRVDREDFETAIMRLYQS